MANPDRARFDVNKRPTLAAVSNVDGETPVSLWADPNTHTLITTAGGGGGSGDGAILDGVNATVKATVFDLVNSNPQAMQIVDANGDAITSFGGGTQYTNGVVVASPVGSVALGYDGANVRAMAVTPEGYQDIANGYKDVVFSTGIVAAVGTTDVSNYKWVSVHIVTQGTSSSVAFQVSNDNTNWVALPLMVSSNLGDAVPATSVTSAGVLYFGAINAKYFRLNVTGISAGTTAGVIQFSATGSPLIGSMNVGRVGSIVAGTAATNLGKAEDAAHTSGDTGVFMLGVRNDAQTTLSSTDGDYSAIATDGPGNVRSVGNVSAAATDAGAPVKVGAVYNSTLPTYTTGQRGDAQITARGALNVQVGIGTDAATAIAGAVTNADAVATSSVGNQVLVVSRNTVYNGTTFDRMRGDTNGVFSVVKPVTSGGLTMSKLVSAATTNATSLKASAGQIYGIQVYNTNAAARYLKLYNKASAPTVGTDVPVKVITIPGNTAGAGSNVSFGDLGVAFATGIAYALTTGAADSDTGAVALSEIIVNIDYA